VKSDFLTRFILEGLNIRGEFVVLHNTTQEILSKQDYPAKIKNLLGEMTCASILLSGTLKIKGRTSIQAKGSGPITSIMAETTDQGDCRGIAVWQKDEHEDLPETATLQAVLGQQALLVFTVTPQAGQPYQGIVSMEKASLAPCLEDYFMRSEQLNTMIRLFNHGDYWGGLLLQQLPAENSDSHFAEQWQEITLLMGTLTFSELLQTDPKVILSRLFHQHDVRLLNDSPIQFQCSCSEQRTLNALKIIGKQEAYAIIAEQGAVDMNCQFCNHHYHFDAAKIHQLFDDPTLH